MRLLSQRDCSSESQFFVDTFLQRSPDYDIGTMNEMDAFAAERQHLLDMGTPPQVIDLLFAERIARIAAERDAERKISRERYIQSIQYSCRNDWLAGIHVLYG